MLNVNLVLVYVPTRNGGTWIYKHTIELHEQASDRTLANQRPKPEHIVVYDPPSGTFDIQRRSTCITISSVVQIALQILSPRLSTPRTFSKNRTWSTTPRAPV